jgi:hypothetical protein
MQWIDTKEELDKIDLSSAEIKLSGKKIKDFNHLRDFENLKRLTLNSVVIENLELIGGLKSLEYLGLTNTANGQDLEPLINLTELKELILQTPPGWDGSGKKIVYKSLKPLSNLRELQSLTLLDIVFEEDGLEPLYDLDSLVKLETRNTFTTKDFAKLGVEKPDLDCRYTRPYTIWDGFEWYKCKTCGQMRVEFSGVDLKRRIFCLNCNSKKCQELINRYNDYINR